MLFLFCGTLGLILEILWTGFGSLINHNLNMKGTTSIIMFPIYGLAFLIKPVYKFLRKFPFYIRGSIYTAAFFLVEFFSGCLLKKLGCCPWDYSKSPFNIKGVIRIDYAPVWFFTGLLFEKLLYLPDVIGHRSKK